MNTCTQCSNEIPEGGKFCPGCGAPHHAEATVPSSTQDEALVFAGSAHPATGSAADTLPVVPAGNGGATVPPVPPTGEASTVAATHQPTGAPASSSARQLNAARITELFNRASIDSDHVGRAGRTALLGTGPLLGLSLLLVVLTATLAGPEGHHGAVVDWIRAAVWVAGLAWHGTWGVGVRGEGNGYGISGAVDGAVSTTAAPLLLTLGTLALLAWASRREERQRPSVNAPQLVARALATSGVLAGAWLVLALLSRSGSPFGLDPQNLGLELSDHVKLSVGLSPVRTALSVFVLALPTSLVARGSARTVASLVPTVLHPWASALRSALRLTIAVLTAAAVSGLVYFLVDVVRAMGDDQASVTSEVGNHLGAGPWLGLGVVLLYLPNLLVAGAGFSMGSGLTGSGDGSVSGALADLLDMSDLPVTSRSYGLFSDSEHPAWLYLLLLVAVVAMLAASIRTVVRDAPSTRVWATSGRSAVAMGLLWAALAWLASLGMGVKGSASGSALATDDVELGGLDWHGRIGLSLVGVVTLAMLWAVLVHLTARWVTPRLGGAAPRTVAVLGAAPRRHLNAAWALQLADATARLQKPVPAFLRRQADEAAREGIAVEQLVIRPGLARKIVVVSAGLVTLVVVAFGGQAYLSSTTFGPKAVAESYLQAVAGGRADEAIGMVAGAPTDKVLMSDSALKAQLAAAPMKDVRVTRTETTDTTSTVNVSYEIQGRRESTSLVLQTDEAHSRWGGLFHTWRVVDPFASVEVSSEDGPVTINGKSVTAGSHPVFPGAVRASRPATDILEAFESTASVPRPGDVGTIEVSSSPKSEVTGAIRARIAKEIEGCMAQPVLAPSGCPFKAEPYLLGSAVKVSWSADSSIEDVIDLAYTGGNGFRVSGELPLTVSYTDVSDYLTDPETAPVYVDLSGTVSYTGKDSMIVFWDANDSDV